MASGQRHAALEAVERFEDLDRVALDARAETLPHDGVEVDEATGAQQRSTPARASRSGPSAA